MKKISFLLFIFSVMVANSAQAAWTGPQTVHRVYASAQNMMFVQTHPYTSHINPSGCANPHDYRMDIESPMFDKQYQMLLTALAAGKKVGMSIDGCIGDHPKIHSIIIYR